MYKKLMFFLLLATSVSLCFSQPKKPGSKNIDSILTAVDHKFTNGEDSLLNHLTILSKEDSGLKKALSEYQLFGLQHRIKTLQWNYTSTIIIFWCVIFLVFSGIVFAGLQFYKAFYAKNIIAGTQNAGIATEVEASLKGIKVSSPVLGVIILTLSLLFFYLYLMYVYPISEIF